MLQTRRAKRIKREGVRNKEINYDGGGIYLSVLAITPHHKKIQDEEILVKSTLQATYKIK
jgi:hypothetical protein